jgi:hypothetical protein
MITSLRVHLGPAKGLHPPRTALQRYFFFFAAFFFAIVFTSFRRREPG